MNIFKANTKLAGRLGPISGIEENNQFVQRVKPLYFCTEKEVRLYTLLKGFEVQFTECSYSSEGYRYKIQDILNEMENNYKGTKQGIINSFLDLQPLLQEREFGNISKIGQCSSCKEPAQLEICNACLMKEAVNEI
jgi:cytoplasmic tRNA 2-thiolation protein 1